ncbi:MAG: PCI domain-containing protein, partial [Candidatus Heimdallarchaeaceae archaeon]
MSTEQEIAIILAGYRVSPFIREALHKEDIAFTIIANNTSDFQIHHADPSKILNCSLEFSNTIEIKAQKNMDSLAVFETLGQFFDFYNPLHLSTLNYLISKFATSTKTEDTKYVDAWKEISTAIFDDEFILPLFSETRIIHVKEGDVEIPVRQFLISTEIEQRKDNTKNNIKTLEQTLTDITGIIDLEEIAKMKICSEASRKIVNASAVIIVPTDIISFYIMFQSENFRDILEKTSGKIAFIPPFWVGNEINKFERTILEKSGFEANLTNITDLVKDSVDTIIIDNKDSDLVPTLREAGITVLVEELTQENLASQEFLETVLRSVDVTLESITIEPKEIVEGLGDKLVNLFRGRVEKKDMEEVQDLLTIETSPADIPIPSVEETLPEISIDEKKYPSILEEPTEEEDFSITDEFEMEVIDTEELIPTIPSTPSKEIVKETDFLQPISDGKFILPGIEQIKQLELEDIESLDVDEHIINSFIDRAMNSNTAGLEVVFSDLLALQNNPLLIDKIYQTLMRKAAKVREFSPEEKIVDIITYLSAHKPEFYTERIETLLDETLHAKEEKEFHKNLRKSTLVIKSSLLIVGEVIEKFIWQNITTDDIYLEDKLRRIISSIAFTDTNLLELVAKVLASIFTKEIQTEDPRDTILDRIMAFLSLFDGCTVGIAFILTDFDEVIESIIEKFETMHFSVSYEEIVKNILHAYKDGTYEDLIEALRGRDLPESIEFDMMKRKYIKNLSKVGSIPLEIFAENLRIPIEKAEKVIYDMILKEEITARIELVSGRLYIVQDQKEKEEETIEKTEEKIKEKVSVKKPSVKKATAPTKKPPVKKATAPAKKPPVKKATTPAKKPPVKKATTPTKKPPVKKATTPAKKPPVKKATTP